MTKDEEIAVLDRALEIMEADMKELKRALAIMWHAWSGDHRPPNDVLLLAHKCYEEGRGTTDGNP